MEIWAASWLMNTLVCCRRALWSFGIFFLVCVGDEHGDKVKCGRG